MAWHAQVHRIKLPDSCVVSSPMSGVHRLRQPRSSETFHFYRSSSPVLDPPKFQSPHCQVLPSTEVEPGNKFDNYENEQFKLMCFGFHSLVLFLLYYN